jgi:hypothetical protein
MSKQTAVEWLIEELGEYFPHEIGGIHLMVDRAKQMEKEQIIDARISSPITTGDIMLDKQEAEQYYNESYINEK